MKYQSFALAVIFAALSSSTDATKVCSSTLISANAVPEICGLPKVWGALSTINPTALSTFDKHEVISDGYKLSMVRITSSTSSTLLPANVGAKGPVLLVHGLSTDGIAWFNTNTPTATPAFLPQTLYNNGYDVWIAN